MPKIGEDKMSRCSICGATYFGPGFDAAPVKKGRCCSDCWAAVVSAVDFSKDNGDFDERWLLIAARNEKLFNDMMKDVSPSDLRAWFIRRIDELLQSKRRNNELRILTMMLSNACSILRDKEQR